MARGTDPYALWVEAGGGTPGYDRQRYLSLLREHGHVLRPGDDGYEEAARSALPCGWSPRMESALASLDKSPQRREAPKREPWCEKFDMPAIGCAHCTGRTGEPEWTAEDRAKWGPWFEARHPGRCSACDTRIHEGDRIRADGEGGYLCVCVDDGSTP